MCSVPLPGICPEYVGDARPSVSGMVWRSSRWRRLQRSTARTASDCGRRHCLAAGRGERCVEPGYNHIKRGGNFQLRLTPRRRPESRSPSALCGLQPGRRRQREQTSAQLAAVPAVLAARYSHLRPVPFIHERQGDVGCTVCSEWASRSGRVAQQHPMLLIFHCTVSAAGGAAGGGGMRSSSTGGHWRPRRSSA
jgi:hypothetical protein